MAALKTLFMAEDIAWKDFVDGLEPIVTLNGTEVIAGIDSDGEKGSMTTEQIAALASVGGGSVFTDKVTLSSAEILALNTTPKLLVPAKGAGKLIRFLGIIFNVNYGTVAYATNTTMLVAQGVDWQGLITVSSVLSTNFTISAIRYPTTPPAATGTGIPANQPLTLYVQTGNPTAGDGTMDVYTTYTVIDI